MHLPHKPKTGPKSQGSRWFKKKRVQTFRTHFQCVSPIFSSVLRPSGSCREEFRSGKKFVKVVTQCTQSMIAKHEREAQNPEFPHPTLELGDLATLLTTKTRVLRLFAPTPLGECSAAFAGILCADCGGRIKCVGAPSFDGFRYKSLYMAL